MKLYIKKRGIKKKFQKLKTNHYIPPKEEKHKYIQKDEPLSCREFINEHFL